MTVSTQNHRREQLLVGWEQEQLQGNSNFEGTAMLPPDQTTMEQQQNNEKAKQMKMAQDTSIDVPWAIGKYFFLVSLFSY